LKVIGSRNRKYINEAGEKVVLRIRRLRCCACSRIHHELPDILVPYKRYDSSSIEAVVIDDSSSMVVSADESTLRRWKTWFKELVWYIIGCLQSISLQNDKRSAEDNPRLPVSPLQRILFYVGDAKGWLAGVVRPIANNNFWVHTRSAFLSRS
jgi:hypothetical protein